MNAKISIKVSPELAKKLDKIQKLLDRADGTDFEAEAEACLRKAHEFMASEGLSEADLAAHSREEELGELGSNWLNDDEDGKIYYNWKKILISCLSYYFDCYIVTDHIGSRKTRIDIIGRDANRITFQIMFNWIHDKTMKEARDRYHTDTARRNSYCLGVVNALAAKIYKIKPKANVKDAWGIVPIDETKAFAHDKYPMLRKGKKIQASASMLDAYREGKEVGDSISLNRQFGLKAIGA